MKNKNIIFITHTYTTFQKSQIESVAEYFDNVYVFVRYKPIAEISRLLPIRYLRAHSLEASINQKNKPDNVQIFPIPVFYFPWKSSYLKLGDLLLKKIRKIIIKNEIKFDIIHAHYIWTSGYVASKLKEVYKKPFLITNHSTLQLTEYIKRNSTWNQKITDTISSADHIFVVNNFMKKMTLNIYSSVNVDVIPIGFDQNIFFPIAREKARDELSLPDGVPIIINISRLDDNKNLAFFIKGCAQLLKRKPNFQSLIIGEGVNFAKLQKLINDLGVEESIKLVGMVPHNKINLWINAANGVALTSFSEGSPTVMYETIACGKPFIGSAVGGIPEIIKNENYGLLIDPYQLSDFVKKLEIMIEKDWDHKKILSYGNRFSQKTICEDIIAVYNRLLEV